jgi:hypothetical protein
MLPGFGIRDSGFGDANFYDRVIGWIGNLAGDA